MKLKALIALACPSALGKVMLQNIRFNAWLRVQVFVSGFAIMALELLGSRLITPVFGNSTSTWGSLIGVVLAGLAGGYQYGGKLADRSPTRVRFSTILFTGAVFVILVPFIAPSALALSLSLGLGDRYGPVLATTLILGLPTFLLGMTSPFALRMGAQQLASLGNLSGNLYSISTVGSILGTFGTVFVLIPLWDVRSIIFGLGVILMLVAVIWLPRFSVIIAALFILLLATSATSTLTQVIARSGSVVYEKETPYSLLDVVDLDTRRTLYLNGLPQSAMDINDPTRLVYAYTAFFNFGFVINPDLKDVLFVGGGGFSGPKYFLSTHPGVQVDVAEIDPDVIETARKYFAVNPDPRLNVFNEDGRLYLSETGKTYDLIVLDAYAKSYVPFHLLTREFMQLVASHLSPNGVVISNLIGSLVGDTSNLVRAAYKTASDVFPNSIVFATQKFGGFVQNVILVYDKAASPRLTALLNNRTASAGEYLDYLYRDSINTDDIPLLTDNYAPVETLLNPVTGRAYVIEQQVGRLLPATAVEGNYLITLSLLAVVSGVWIIYVARTKQDA